MVSPRFLLLQPLPQTPPVCISQRPQGLLGVLGDVAPIGRQVQSTNEKPLWGKRHVSKNASQFQKKGHSKQSESNLTWSSQVFFAVHVADHSISCVLVGPPIWDFRPELPISCCLLGLIWQNNLVARGPEMSQRQVGLLQRPWCLSCWNDFRLFNLLPEISKITHRLRAKLRTKHPCQGENKGLMESLIHSFKMATSKDDNLLWMRPQPGGNTLQRFLQRRNF